MKLQEALEKLKSQGYKTTAKRNDILAYFDEADGYRTAKDLLQHMEPTYKGISFDTLYRNLHLFDEVGILETTELNGEKHFRITCTHHHHHHFICKDCGKTKEIDVCPMNEVQNSLGNYAIEGHKFEIYGLCPVCQDA
ncbi:Fur family transcriptional regulator [Virgibacillus litoralis]|uniref:Fur family zinc uptake transcriptional regulator n=1 Tax=Virgibacillus litoralis TaxID=578221 RepID=A0ABS4HGV6_9BACI|nr:Fur family transcriptional regulator [Virgibacillus litoralis]MBP1950150.1 Fur family zinc uptake transcriptional regulator [Virgibacillus litoralis]